MHDIRFAGVVDDALFKSLDFEDLHFHDEPSSHGIGALDIDDGHLELGNVDVLIGRRVLNVDDAVLALELEQMVDESDEQMFARLDAEDALEDEVCPGIGERGVHDRGVRHAETARKGITAHACFTQSSLRSPPGCVMFAP